MVMGFGRARFRQSPPVFDKIFDKEGLTLEAVMDCDDDAVSELKFSNKKFLDFLDNAKIEILIDYMIVEPPEHLDAKLRYKYPYTACELLACGCPEINNRIVNENSLLERLYNYLSSQEGRNITSLGYVCKVFQSLLSTKAYEVLRFLHDEDRIDLAIRHFYSKSVADLIGRLLSCEEYGSTEFQDDLFSLIEKILFCISPENSVETVFNASNLLIELLSKKIEIKNWGYIFGHLLGDQCIEYVFKQVFEGNLIVKKEATKLLCSLINNVDIPDPEHSDDDSRIIDEEDQKIIVEMIKHTEQIESTLKNPEGTIKTTFNEEIPIVGEGKIRMIEILAAAIKIPSQRFNTILAESQIIQISTDLMFQSFWNSFLHQAYCKFIASILESKSDSLKLTLLSQAQLPHKLYELSQFQIISNQRCDIRKGHLGFATKIGNIVIENSSCTTVDNFLAKLDEWKNFVNDFLVPQNRLDCLELGGKPAETRSRFSSEQDYDLPESATSNVEETENKEQEEEAKEPAKEIEANELFEKNNRERDEYSDFNYWKPETKVKVDELEDL
ncbi:PPP6R3 [Blepharisma stoltei]|uniref:Uncharacterized protein n=1 Tax=Blepharisma stoltei TaxID=1481888 RepID=A0AAU9IVK9_9CILI|nr:unnamed protein product [Blepharisma stoltei]